MELTAEELRVLGCLIEKQATTPEHYPLSTNALVNACNQKSSRVPVADYSERTVLDAMLLVRQKGLARMNSSGRTDKHRHILDDALGLDRDQLALLAVMMLRGPQSTGELKRRTERYSTSQGTGFESVDDIEAVLAQLAGGIDPFVANVGRASGQSQDRWAHLLGDEVPTAQRSSAVSGWHPNCYQRAVAFVTDQRGRLLVFDHLDVDAGTQVPGGGIHEGESAKDAARRELAEESGLDSAVVVRKLGETWNRSEPGNVPAGLEEHILHAFHLTLDRPSLRETWEWEEKSGGDAVEHRFAFRWVSLDEAATLLWPHQAMWINAVRLSLRHPAD